MTTTEPASGQRPLLNASEAAELFGLSKREVYRLASLPPGAPGALPAGVVVRLGRRVRFSRARLLELVGESCKGSAP